jgi:two-component system NtrC family sensor kinase
MKAFVKIIPFLLLPLFVGAQLRQKQSDSLHLALKNAVNDKIRMSVYNGLAYFFSESNTDSAIFFFEKQSALAAQLKLKIDQVEALDMTGYLLSKQGNYPKSLETFMLAKKIAEDPASEKHIWHLPKGRTPEDERLIWLGWVNNDIGFLYHSTGEISKELSGYQQAKKIAESIHSNHLLSFVYQSLGVFYMNAGKLDSALFFEKKAQSVLMTSGELYGGVFLNTIGSIYQKQGNFKLSRDAFNAAIKVNEKVNNLSSLGDSYLSLGSLYEIEKKPDSSLACARKGLAAYKVLELPDGIARAYNLISAAYRRLHQTDSAFAYLKLARGLQDSLNNAERKNLLAFQKIGFDERLKLDTLEKEKIETQTKIRTYTMLAGIAIFVIISSILYRNNKQKQKANKVLESTLTKLKSTQNQLVQREKMASLGELTAGIAHEIQNPLNFVNNFSEVSSELVDEMDEELDKGDIAEAKAIGAGLKQNLEKIRHHGQRADFIVKGMLEHSRTSTAEKQLTDLNVLCDEFMKLSYHGLRAKDKNFNAELITNFDEQLPKVEIAQQDIGRVLLNLFNNAFYAVNQKLKTAGPDYKPTVEVGTSAKDGAIEIKVKDNGNGIPGTIKDKIMQPFFTTKPTGEGTGLGLSLSYDIVVKGHGGTMTVDTKEGEFTEFTILFPN